MLRTERIERPGAAVTVQQVLLKAVRLRIRELSVQQILQEPDIRCRTSACHDVPNCWPLSSGLEPESPEKTMRRPASLCQQNCRQPEGCRAFQSSRPISS